MDGNARTRGHISQFQCQLCGLATHNKAELLNHLKQCSEQKMKVLFEANQCLICQNAFLSNELLLVHISTCSMEQLEILKKMGQISEVINREGNTHVEMSSDASNILCKTDKRKNKVRMLQKEMEAERTAATLEDHDDAESQSNKYENINYSNSKRYGNERNQGSESLSTDDNSHNNIATFESMEEMSKRIAINCQGCGKSYSSNNLLKSHNDTAHLGKNSIQCNICGKASPTMQTLRKHDEATHQGLKPFKCNSCEQSFTEQGSMRRHNASIHEKIRHLCNLCGKSYPQKTKLNDHKQIAHWVVLQAARRASES